MEALLRLTATHPIEDHLKLPSLNPQIFDFQDCVDLRQMFDADCPRRGAAAQRRAASQRLLLDTDVKFPVQPAHYLRKFWG
jgi:hypothetical protein